MFNIYQRSAKFLPTHQTSAKFSTVSVEQIVREMTVESISLMFYGQNAIYTYIMANRYGKSKSLASWDF